MKRLIIFIITILYSFQAGSQSLFNPYEEYDLSRNYVVCDLTGKETEYYAPLSFNSGKLIDEDIYDLLKEDFDSAMQIAFDIFWEKKYIEYEQTRGINAYKKKEHKIQLARINLIEAQFKYNKELGVPIDSTLISEYCDLIDKNRMWGQALEYCAGYPIKDTLLFFNTDRI